MDKKKYTDPSFHTSSMDVPSMSMSKFGVIKNLVVLCLGFLVLFCAFKGLSNLQSTMNREGGVGVISQSVIYLGFLISALLLPKMIISYLGCKRTIVFSILAYSPYIAANVYPHFGTIAPTAVLVGLAAGPLWSSQSVYLTEIANQYSTFTTANNEVVVSTFFGAFLMVYGSTDVWGNLVSYYVLMPDVASSTHQDNASLSHCGIEFCFANGQKNSNLDPPSDEKRYTLIGIYLFCAILAAVIVAAFLNPLKVKIKDDAKKEGLLSLIGAALKNLRRTEQMLLVPICVFSGAERGFIIGEYTMGYIACAWGIYHVGFVTMCYGATVTVISLTSGYVLKCIPRPVIMVSGSAAMLSACVGMIYFEPRAEESYMFFILSGVWGYGDAVVHTHVRSLQGLLFKDEKEGAFSNYLLWESVGYVIIFGSSKYVCMRIKLGIVIFLLAAGMLGYFGVEVRSMLNRKKCYSLSNEAASPTDCNTADMSCVSGVGEDSPYYNES